MEVQDNIISLESELFSFNRYFEANSRCVLSAPFGEGKSFFLDEFIKKKSSDYDFITLYPTWKQEKITPQQAVEAVLGLVNMIGTDKLAKLNKLDEIEGLKTGLEEVKTQIKAFDATLSQPVKIEDPVR